MGEFIIKMPDIGEGIAEAEVVEWLVKPGQSVVEDEALAVVMTDKANVEIPSPVIGKVLWLGPAIGDQVQIGTPIIRLEIDGEGNVSSQEQELEEADKGSAEVSSEATRPSPSKPKLPTPEISAGDRTQQRPSGERPVAAPSVRAYARSNGVDLRLVAGSGPGGRITSGDVDTFLNTGRSAGASNSRMANVAIEEIRVVGLRRRIAEKVSVANSRIPHITYVDEVDMTSLEGLRGSLNKSAKPDQDRLTLLPFLMQAMIRAISEMPEMNARYDDQAGIIHQHGGIHIGVATQTGSGLIVPVVRHAEALSLRECASALSRVAAAAKEGTAKREELSGSTITITSLGALGGLVTTPIINHPEVAIIGVNKMRTVPVWDGTQFMPRKVMNLSSSFDHRVIDGWNAAVFIQRIKALLETPALIFIED